MTKDEIIEELQAEVETFRKLAVSEARQKNKLQNQLDDLYQYCEPTKPWVKFLLLGLLFIGTGFILYGYGSYDSFSFIVGALFGCVEVLILNA